MKKAFLIIAALAFGVAHAAAQQEELLEPEKAFQVSARVLDAQTVEARWDIADGYYLYRDKLKFEVQGSGASIQETRLPAGKKKHDEFFGEVETYRKSVTAVLKFARGDNGALPLKLSLASQGCADLGVCYPPQTQTVDLKLPAAAAGATAAKPGAIAALRDLIAPRGDGEFLDPDQAFIVSATAGDAGTVFARIDIAKGYYLYRDKTAFQSGAPEQVQLGAYEMPAGKIKDDEFFGKTEVYYDRVEVRLPVTGQADAMDLVAKYQGCAEKGICYPPTTKTIRVELPAVSSNSVGAVAAAPLAGTASETLLLAVLGAFGAGLLLTFTPCVLPMVPILSSVIVGAGDRKLSKLEGGMLSYSYVLGTAFTYTIAGAIAGATGDQLQAYFQNPWAIGTFSTLLVLLALSMFGFYELQMPGFVQSFLHHHSSRLHHHSKKVPGGTYAGVFIMGIFSALIVGACVSPVLISALGAAITSKDPWLGAGIMFSLAHGQGMILIALGVGAGFLLPKAGHWMNQVKHVFGVLLLGVAIFLLNALPQVPVLLLWGALFIVVAVYLRATQSLPKDANGWAYFWKGIGTFLLIWGVLALVGGFAGNRDILRPLPLAQLAGATSAGGEAAAPALFERVTTAAAMDERLAAARAAGKPAIVDYYATWCTDCVRMERSTFVDPKVRQALARFALIQVDVTDNNAASQAAKQRLGVFGPPAMIFFDAKGDERKDLRVYGYKNPQQFLALLERL